MALHTMRIGVNLPKTLLNVGRVLDSNLHINLFRLQNAQKVVIVQAAGIAGRAMRGPDFKLPEPYPYKEKKFNFIRALFDNTMKRFNENTKLLVVEGNIAAGKSEVAKALAEELGMLYFPTANLDYFYVSPFGTDMRYLDAELPESVRSFEEKHFLMNPTSPRTAGFQIMMYKSKFSQYVDALGHILSTGQGVVLDRSAYSDFVFMEAMVEQGYVSKPACEVYYELKQNTIGDLMRPHLIIYLDVPTQEILRRVRERKIPYEEGSPVLTEQYLKKLETVYKQQFLKEMSTFSELLIYDWSDHGDIEVVVEDIERIDFDNYDHNDLKMKDWRFPDRYWEWADLRYRYTTGKRQVMNNFKIPNFVPELRISQEDFMKFQYIWKNVPDNKYAPGFNPLKGDAGYLFK